MSAAAHSPVIMEEVQELLTKGAIEPSSGGAGFYSNVFVIPKHMGGLWPIYYWVVELCKIFMAPQVILT